MIVCSCIDRRSVIGSNLAAYVFKEMSLARPFLATPLGHVRQCSSEKCKCCVTQEYAWRQELSIGKHGCSVCKNLVDAKCWKRDTLQRHRSDERDLVCPECAERGYAPSRYQSYQCAECLDEFGFRQFLNDLLQSAKRQKNTHLVCRRCSFPKLRCSRCEVGYEDAYWTKNERQNHRGKKKVKLVCKPCRAQGFHPRDIVAYTCQRCKSKFESLKFNQSLLRRSKRHNYKRLQCIQCVAETRGKKASVST